MAYTYWLPDESGNKVDYTTESNSVIIVGANGAGKSKLGAWIEQKDFAKVHRIAAQRGISFNKNIPLKNYTEAENLDGTYLIEQLIPLDDKCFSGLFEAGSGIYKITVFGFRHKRTRCVLSY